MGSGGKLQRNIQPSSLIKGEATKLAQSTDSVLIRSLYPVDMYVTGKFSEKQYHFPKSGSEVKVDLIDVEELLSKRTSRPCCSGGAEGSPIFEKVVGG